MYMNGVQGAVHTSTANGEGSDTSEVLNIGGRQNNDGSHNPAGLAISDVRVYNRALTSVEVATLYVNGRRSQGGLSNTFSCLLVIHSTPLHRVPLVVVWSPARSAYLYAVLSYPHPLALL